MDPLAGYAAIVATYAAIISTVKLGWDIYVGRRDQAHVRLKIRYAAVRGPLGASGAKEGTYFVWDISNEGRRPVTIASFGLDLGKKVIHINPYPRFDLLPHELGEGKSLGLLAVRGRLEESARSEASGPPRRAYVRTATGKTYYSKLPQNIRDELWGDDSYRPWWKVWEQGWWRW